MQAEKFGQLVGCGLLCLCPLVVLILIGVLRSRAGGSAGPAGPAPSTSSTASTGGGYTPPAPTRCGCNSGYTACSCPNGYVYENGQPRVHHLCGGLGKLRCPSCGGTGLR